MTHKPLIRQLSLSDMETLDREAVADKHFVLAPTHVIEKEGELVGYLSIGAIPLVLSWLHTKKVKARDTLVVRDTVTQVLASHGVSVACFPCGDDSPLFPYMSKMGFVPFGNNNTLFMKSVRKDNNVWA